ncbi:MAG: M48 family metallopeptidase [Desulfobacteraceae bacterium]|nr:M48 family metallopeptidase [Desulfobacteraceae bacterium]
MKNIKIILIAIIGIWLIACSTVPITGRHQLNLLPQETMLSMSLSEYDQFLKENQLSNNQAQIQMVKRVGLKIQKAVEQYFAQNNMSDELSNYAWEFNLVESNEINAWCMPGGKVVFYSGILPLTKDETGLAVVMGHEIAHAVAHHGNERMSQGLIAQMGNIALSTALETEPETTQQLWLAVYGLGAQYGLMLPYSRLHENEADRMGLMFMSMAGYDPNAAVGFWQRMAAQKKGAARSEFLSTHPSDKKRIQNIRALIPEAMGYYKKP